MAITKLEKNKVYADGVELGYVGTANPKKIRARFFPQTITTTNHQTNVTQKQNLASPIILAQVLDGTGGPWTDRSVWAPHPREWFATEKVEGGVVYSPAHTAEEIQYFANNAKFLEIGFKSADGTANQDPRHFGNATTKKEGEDAVSGFYFIINDSGVAIRCDKDGKLLNPDGTYVNDADDPAKKNATGGATLAADGDATSETLVQKIKTNAKTILLWVGGVLVVVVVGSWLYKALTKKKKKK
ncbi:hypothetical protein [Runella zeae]|uniref:hypothetical protein n=1 Tax=Runella zeae TaxID=94255 RepID=UPI000422D17F|nr:hypothetical protein [Runella zeae]